jgi:hypothetical protein
MRNDDRRRDRDLISLCGLRPLTMNRRCKDLIAKRACDSDNLIDDFIIIIYAYQTHSINNSIDKVR